MLSQIMTKISGGVTFLGGVLIVFGLVNLGMTIKDGMQGGGGQLAGAIAMIVGGGIVIAASVFSAAWTPVSPAKGGNARCLALQFIRISPNINRKSSVSLPAVPLSQSLSH